jgi:DNA-binding GntR family transcriptional regulator
LLNKKGIPLYIQLKDLLLKDIKENYKAGDIIPAEPKLEEIYKVSRITIRKAIEELEREHIVQKKQGRGTFVLEQKVMYEANSVGSLTQRLAQQNYKLKTVSLEYSFLEGEHYVKELLHCEKILVVKRLRLLNGVPFAIMCNYLDYHRVEGFEKRFNIESLYRFIKDEYGIEFYNAKETIEAIAPKKNEKEQLHIKDNTPLLSLDRVSYDIDGNAVEYSNVKIKGDMYQHTISLKN